MTGTVSHYGRKGFGWIEVDDTRQSAFVHIADVRGRVVLRSGDRVRFSLRNAPKGLKAIDVEVIENDAQAPAQS